MTRYYQNVSEVIRHHVRELLEPPSDFTGPPDAGDLRRALDHALTGG